MQRVPSTCRICNNVCGIVVGIDEGKVISVTGDELNPYSRGYTCLKGRAYPDFINHPDRLLTSMKRTRDGKFEPISSEQALDEIADRLFDIRERHGPNAIANYTGTLAAWTSTSTLSVAPGFMQALGSWMSFNPATIDQPGRPIAQTIQGLWQAPFAGGAAADAILLLGINSLVSYIGLPTGHVPRNLKELQARGTKLIVVDPRNTELARRADLHLQARPGTDIEIVASLIYCVLTEGLQDQAFLVEHAEGVEQLRDAVAPFDPDTVAEIADIPADLLRQAARIFAGARHGYALSGTGPNMGQPGTLLAYLLLNLDVLCGHFLRAGDKVHNIGALAPRSPFKAQVVRVPVRNHEHTLAGQNLPATILGPPLTSLPDQMCVEGPERVRALISCGGNPVMAWPDQKNVLAGLDNLELLVTIDPFMSETARRSDYVIAPRMGLEQPATTQILDLTYTMGHGPARTYGMYAPAVVEPPPGSDVLHDWEVYYGLAKRLGLTLLAIDLWGILPPASLNMDEKPTSEQLLSIISRQSNLPLEVIKSHSHGRLFPEMDCVVLPRDADNKERLRLADPALMRELAERVGRLPEPSLRLISRRMMHVMNSTFNQSALRGRRSWNPACLHPDDMAEMGLHDGDIVSITSAKATVQAIVEGDATLRPGLISLTHCFGSVPGQDDPVLNGANTSRLVESKSDFDPWSGQPRMSNISVTVTVAGPRQSQDQCGETPLN